MPYAKNDTISDSPIKGGITISKDQYDAAFAAKMNGQETDTVDGKMVIYSAAMRQVYSTESGLGLEIPQNKETPEGFTDIERPSPYHKWVNGAWVEDEEEVRLSSIRQLEAEITPRRMREAMLTESGKSWLQNIENQIGVLRGQL